MASVPGAFSIPAVWSGWFTDWVKRPPDWLKAYRSTWRPQQNNCALSDVPVSEFIACLQRFVPDKQKDALAKAVLEVHSRLQPHWQKEQLYLDMFVERLHALMQSRSGQDAVRELRWFWDMDPAKPLDFTIVLVLTPRHHPRSRPGGQQSSGYLTLAVNLNRSVGSHTDTIFHELCHLAAQHSRQRQAFEDALIAEGEDGLIAGAYWNEAIASAFGRGIFAVRFNGPFDPQKRRFYQHVAVDNLARGLYQNLTIDRSLRFGSTFGQRLSNIAAIQYPASQRTLRDFLNRFLLVSTDSRLPQAIFATTHLADLWHLTNWQSDQLPRFKHAAPMVIVMNKSQLLARPRMLGSIGISTQSLSSFISQHNAGYYWQNKSTSHPILLVTAHTQDQTIAALVKLLRISPKVRPVQGWRDL